MTVYPEHRRGETVRRAEIQFKKLYNATGDGLIPADDWYSPSKGIIYEIKEIAYPSWQFRNVIRISKDSVIRHAKEDKKCLFVLMFNDGVIKAADALKVLAVSHEDMNNLYGDGTTTFLVPINIFRIITDMKELWTL